MKRRSKRKAAVLNHLLEDGRLRRSKRKLSKRKEDEEKFGQDYGVPLGFVCGYPLLAGAAPSDTTNKNSSTSGGSSSSAKKNKGSRRRGELYGGSMFARSAASDTLQGKAIQSVNETWGEDFLERSGRESLGHPVCKKKYAPFKFIVEEADVGDASTTTAATTSSAAVCKPASSTSLSTPPRRVVVRVQRLFGCACHHDHRKRIIEQYGLRPQWEPYGQWSMKKAQELARRETQRLNQYFAQQHAEAGAMLADGGDSTDSEDTSALSRTSRGSSSSSEGNINNNNNNNNKSLAIMAASAGFQPSSFCVNGACLWKVKSAFDNIYQEIHGCTESEAEDNGDA